MSDFIPSSPQQLEVYNAAIAAGVPPAGIRLFIQNEKQNFKTESDGSVSFGGIPISTKLRTCPEIASKYKAPAKTPMTVAEFSRMQLAGKIPISELSSVEIVSNSRQPLASANRVPYVNGIGPVMGGWR